MLKGVAGFGDQWNYDKIQVWTGFMIAMILSDHVVRASLIGANCGLMIISLTVCKPRVTLSQLAYRRPLLTIQEKSVPLS